MEFIYKSKALGKIVKAAKQFRGTSVHEVCNTPKRMHVACALFSKGVPEWWGFVA